MAFKLVDLFVDISARGIGGVNKAVDGLKGSLSGLKDQFSATQTAAKAFLAGVGAAAAFAVKQFADEEEAQANLRAALEATGQEVDANSKRLVEFATHLQDVTTNSADALENIMAYATNLGVTADQMENVVRVGVGLGKAFFGGDSKAGVQAASMAMQGNFRALQKVIPAIKEAKSQQEALNIVVAAGQRGFRQATAEADTFWGKLKILWNQVGDLSEIFGEMLLPVLHTAADYLKAITTRLQQMSPEQARGILRWTAYAAALAAVVAFGPAVLSFAGGVTSALVGIGKVAVATGRLLIVGLLSPFGLVVGGLAGVASAFAFFAGTGNTAVSKVIDGFGRVWEAISFVMNNTSTLAAAWGAVVAEAGFYFNDVWANVAATFQDTWLRVKDFFQGLWIDLRDAVAASAFGAAESFLTTWVKAYAAYRNMTVDVGDGIASYWVSLKEKLGMISKEEAAQAQKIIGQSNNATRGGNDSGHATELADIKHYYQQQREMGAKMHDASKRQQAEATADARRENYRRQADALRSNADAKKKFEADLAAKQRASGMKSLADQAKTLFDNLRKGTGVDDMLAQIEAIKREAEKIKADAKGEGQDGGNFGLNGVFADKQKGQTPKRQGLEEVFRQNLTAKMTGQAAQQSEQQQRRQLIEAYKQNTKILEQNNALLKQRMSGGATAGFGGMGLA